MIIHIFICITLLLGVQKCLYGMPGSVLEDIKQPKQLKKVVKSPRAKEESDVQKRAQEREARRVTLVMLEGLTPDEIEAKLEPLQKVQLESLAYDAMSKVNQDISLYLPIIKMIHKRLEAITKQPQTVDIAKQIDNKKLLPPVGKAIVDVLNNDELFALALQIEKIIMQDKKLFVSWQPILENIYDKLVAADRVTTKDDVEFMSEKEIKKLPLFDLLGLDKKVDIDAKIKSIIQRAIEEKKTLRTGQRPLPPVSQQTTRKVAGRTVSKKAAIRKKIAVRRTKERPLPTTPKSAKEHYEALEKMVRIQKNNLELSQEALKMAKQQKDFPAEKESEVMQTLQDAITVHEKMEQQYNALYKKVKGNLAKYSSDIEHAYAEIVPLRDDIEGKIQKAYSMIARPVLEAYIDQLQAVYEQIIKRSDGWNKELTKRSDDYQSKMQKLHQEGGALPDELRMLKKDVDEANKYVTMAQKVQEDIKKMLDDSRAMSISGGNAQKIVELRQQANIAFHSIPLSPSERQKQSVAPTDISEEIKKRRKAMEEGDENDEEEW